MPIFYQIHCAEEQFPVSTNKQYSGNSETISYRCQLHHRNYYMKYGAAIYLRMLISCISNRILHLLEAGMYGTIRTTPRRVRSYAQCQSNMSRLSSE